MSRAKFILAGVLILAAIGAVYASRARANWYWMIKDGEYVSVGVDFTCNTGGTGCVYNDNGVTRQLYMAGATYKALKN